MYGAAFLPYYIIYKNNFMNLSKKIKLDKFLTKGYDEDAEKPHHTTINILKGSNIYGKVHITP